LDLKNCYNKTKFIKVGVYNMKISLLGGTGSFAEGLVIRWAKAGHEVIIGSRTQEKADAAAAEIGAKAKEQGVVGNIVGLENGEAAKATEVVVVCLPPEYTKATLEGISDSFTDQIVISPVVPMQFGKVVSYSPPEAGSAAVEIQNTLPDSVKVVSAYHNIPAKGLANFEKPLDYDVVICGDDDDAKALVVKLTEEMPNLKAIDAGPLEVSSMIEAITPLIINMNKKHKHEFSIKFI
jgi:NADPH-dependent F420 reductase|tara:strand:- start:49135 stop:49845 length:711 start_codon:yes stop_codon:yes gene_type:complete